MKTGLVLPTLLVISGLIFSAGCQDPESVAQPSADEAPVVERAALPQKPEVEPDVSSPDTDRNANSDRPAEKPATTVAAPVDPAGSRGLDPRGSLLSNSPPPPKPDSADRSSLADTDDASADSAAEKESEKNEFVFELVSSTGKEGLETGDTIPDITGRDLDSIRFRLSDYQGKVIMLDFWGDW